jgi:hypothetical protein
MKDSILFLWIITIIEAAPPPAAQYEGRSVGAMPCYIGCCKLIKRMFHRFTIFNLFRPDFNCYPFIDKHEKNRTFSMAQFDQPLIYLFLS